MAIAPTLAEIRRLSETLFTPACDWWKKFKPGDNVTIDNGQADPVMQVILPDDEFVVRESSPAGVVVGWRDGPAHVKIRLDTKKLYRVQLQHDYREPPAPIRELKRQGRRANGSTVGV